jgi:hypothetical protein
MVKFKGGYEEVGNQTVVNGEVGDVAVEPTICTVQSVQ